MEESMKNKTIGIFVCTLMIVATVLPVAGTVINNVPCVPQPDIEWDATYGSNRIDWGNCIQQTSDGGYIISGTYYRNAWSLWYSHFYLIKIDADGNEEWSQTYGLLNSEHVAKSIRETTDGGYIIAGFQGVTYQYDAVVQKTDSEGNLIWENTYGDANAYDTAQSVEQTSDGGYIVTGMTNSYGSQGSDVLLLKIDANGDQEWIKTLGGSDQDSGNCVKQTSDGGYIVVGETDSYGVNGDVYLIKTDATGNEQWSQTFGGNERDGGYSVQQTTDDGYIITGWYKNDIWDSDVYLIKTDATGNEQWSQTFDKGDTEDYGYYGIETSDGGFIATGCTGIYLQETTDVWVIKLKGENQAPNTPTIDGPTSGTAGTEYEYTFTATDPDGDDLYYYIVWGAGCGCGEWIGPYASGEEAIIGHTWTEQGTYVIEAKVKDTSDAESDWATLEITMPRPRTIQFLLLQKILERFPNAFPVLVLRHLLGL